MRLLHRLGASLPVWPIDPLPREGSQDGSLVVEIYTSLAAVAAGRLPGRTKLRSHAELDESLARLGCPPLRGHGPELGQLSDHATDALLTAAWLRGAATRPDLWAPPALAPVAATEGWTFGAP
jgi:hypothetical protein